MARTIENTITNLQFIQQCMACSLKGESMPQSQRTYKRALRSTLASMKMMAKRHRVPELSILADSIYEFTSPKPKSKLRKRIYFFLGAVFFVVIIGIAVITEDGTVLEVFTLYGNDGEEGKKQLKEAFIRTQNAIDILKRLR